MLVAKMDLGRMGIYLVHIPREVWYELLEEEKEDFSNLAKEDDSHITDDLPI